MKIIVCIKQVPGTTEVDIDPETGTLMREGIEAVVNPLDLYAIEEALRLKEKFGGTIVSLSMGPPQAEQAMREALALGCDEAILLTDRAVAGADTWATSFTLRKSIEKIGVFDLIFCGRQAIDGDTAQIGPQVADYLNVPQVTYVFEIEKILKKSIIVKKRLEDGYERVQCNLPALLTVIGELNVPRYPIVGRLIDACKEKSPIKIWNASDIGVQARDVGLEGSFTQVIKTFAPKFKRQGEMLEGDTKKIADTLVEKLKENKLI